VDCSLLQCNEDMRRCESVKTDIAQVFKVTGFKMMLYLLADKPN